MKKRNIYSIALVMLVAVTTGFSQTEKGNFLVGGSLTLSTSNQNDISSTSFGLSPNVSYFFADRFAAGLITNFGLSGSSSDAIGFKNTSSSIGAGPTVRYYFPVADKLYLFPELDLIWSRNHTKSTQSPPATPGTTENTTNASTFRIGAGAAYFIAKNVGLEGFLYYQNVDINGSSTSGVNLRVGLQVYILRGK
jgi:hypothetical protein